MNPPETAPKDGSLILADFGWPWLLPAAWSEMSQKWAVSVLQLSHSGEGQDAWFETDCEKDSDLRGWMEYPKAKTPA